MHGKAFRRSPSRELAQFTYEDLYNDEKRWISTSSTSAATTFRDPEVPVEPRDRLRLPQHVRLRRRGAERSRHGCCGGTRWRRRSTRSTRARLSGETREGDSHLGRGGRTPPRSRAHFAIGSVRNAPDQPHQGRCPRRTRLVFEGSTNWSCEQERVPTSPEERHLAARATRHRTTRSRSSPTLIPTRGLRQS